MLVLTYPIRTFQVLWGIEIERLPSKISLAAPCRRSQAQETKNNDKHTFTVPAFSDIN